MKEYKNCRNPLLPPEIHIADPEAHVMSDGRLYVYGSRDVKPNEYCSTSYSVFSTADMVNWTDHGTSFLLKQVPWAGQAAHTGYPVADWNLAAPTPYLVKAIGEMIPVIGKHPKLLRFLMKRLAGKVDLADVIVSKTTPALFAPDAIERKGKTYLYFCLSDYSEGIAVSVHPSGPFHTVGRLPIAGIDPAVFVDDDGQAYLFWGQFNAWGCRLKENMTELDEATLTKNIVTEEQHGFHEGSSIRKRNGIYYFVYPSVFGGKPSALSYATSDYPLGPYTYRGVIVDNASCDPGSWNIHGSIEEFNGQWYVFYHRPSGNSCFLRRLCAEPITFREDGTILSVPMTSIGAGKPFALGETMLGLHFCELSGRCFDDGSRLTGVAAGDKIRIRYVDW